MREHPEETVRQFEPDVTDRDIEDLRYRLRRTRWPSRETHSNQGIALSRMQALCRYWADGYDPRGFLDRLAAVGQFVTSIDGLSIHFLHARSPVDGAFPLILTHGWPGSVVEFLDTVEPLTRAGFHCVIPSLPGYGFSAEPTEAGWGVHRIAKAWATLMSRLGYRRYGAVGSDWGTSISASLAQQDGEHVDGILLMPPLAPPDQTTFGSLTPRERDALEAMRRGADNDSGYSIQHRTRPQTIGYALTDSPAALAAWIVEKVDAWTDPGSNLSDDTVLDNLMMYWLPGTGASAARLYWESLGDVTRWLTGPLRSDDIVDVATGGTVFPFELQRPSQRWAANRFTNIRYWSEPPLGGHFPAWEQPELFANEVTTFFATLGHALK